MKLLLKLFFATALVAIAVIGFAYSGLYDHRASTPHSGPVHWFLTTTSHASIERQSNAVRVPDISDTSLVHAGVSDFNAMCAGCHGAPGKDPEAVGRGLNPPAPDLAKSAARMSPAELFWVTKHGVGMTGMPAWGVTHDDDALWPVVAFMTALPDMDADTYQEMLASAAGMGHHSSESDSHDHAGGESAAEPDDGHGADTPQMPDHHDAPGAPAHEHNAPEIKEQAAPNDDGHDHAH